MLDFSDSDEMQSVFDGLLREQGTLGPGSDAMMAALMNQCLVLVFRDLCGHPDCRLPWLVALDDPDLADVLDKILANPQAYHTVASLAHTARMSRSAFARQFRESFDRSPMEYVRDVRLRQAARLLHGIGDLSIEAIARRVGFDSRSHFSRSFKDLFGVPPAEFRAEGR